VEEEHSVAVEEGEEVPLRVGYDGMVVKKHPRGNSGGARCISENNWQGGRGTDH